MAAALRWARFDPGRTLVRRPDAQLPFVAEEELAGGPLLLDSCVYIHQLQGKAPDLIERLVETRQVNHSAVAIQEMMVAVGALNPADPRTAGARSAISDLIEAMPPHRLFGPDMEVVGRAALLAGMLARLQGYGREGRQKAMQDCTLFLQAQKLGFTLLTANLAEFDLLLQLVPTGRVLFYR